jgi:hypothetical protein
LSRNFTFFNQEQFNFETLPPALYGETSFAYACGAGGGARRQSISTFSMLKCSKNMLRGINAGEDYYGG